MSNKWKFLLFVVYAFLFVAVVPSAQAQEIVAAGNRFTTLMRDLAAAVAAGLFVLALILKAVANSSGMPRLGAMAGGGMVFAILLLLANRVLTMATDTGNFILG